MCVDEKFILRKRRPNGLQYIVYFFAQIASMVTRIKNYLYKPIPSTQLGLFRILFGICLTYELFYYFSIDLLNKGLRAPAMRFPYEGFEWVKLLPGKSMEVILFLLLIAAVCIALGAIYRIATIFFCTFFAYIFFIDKSLYNNHLYLFVLLCFLLIVTKGDAALSLNKKKQTASIPQWQLLIFRIQVFIVYFYGGLAKINADWLLRHEPMHQLLQLSGYTSSATESMLVYGGLLFDLSIGFLLWFKRTRIIGIIGVLFFNISNAIIFNDIGVFPFFMILSTVLFFEPEVIHQFITKNQTGKKKDAKQKIQPIAFASNNQTTLLLAFYLAFQLVFPFRYLLFPGNVDWYGVGQRFSWRMKIQNRELTELQFTVVDYAHKELMDLDPEKYLTTAQLQALKLDPKMILQFANFLEEDANKKGLKGVGVKAKVKVTFNGHAEQYIVSPETDFTKINYHPFDLRNWVLPLQNEKIVDSQK